MEFPAGSPKGLVVAFVTGHTRIVYTSGYLVGKAQSSVFKLEHTSSGWTAAARLGMGPSGLRLLYLKVVVRERVVDGRRVKLVYLAPKV
jgi:hypothetical protein